MGIFRSVIFIFFLSISMSNYKAKKIYACSIYVQLISNFQWYCRCQRNDSWILKIIGQCDDKYIMMLLIKIITSVLKISTYIMTGITAHSIRLPAILAIMPVSTCRYFILKKKFNALVRHFDWDLSKDTRIPDILAA